MKKFTPAFALLLITFLSISCSVDEDNNIDAATLAQVQGKWKLTKYYTDVASENYPIANGYEIELNSDGTFTSNEEDGFTGGTYTVLKTPGSNLRLTYQKQWAAKVVYKFIIGTEPQHLYLSGSIPDPLPNDVVAYDGFELTRIP